MRVKLFLITLVAAFTFLSVSFTRKNTELKPAHIFHHMYDSIKNIRTIRQNVWAIERIERKFSSNQSEIKLQLQPRKVFYHNPSKHLRVLYDSELAPQRALVKPNVFPYMTLSLDPMGNLMRRNQHYTLHELGYDFIGKSIALTISKDKAGLENFVYKGKVSKNGYTCYLVEYENKSYDYVNYTVGEKESATLIAYKLIVNDYLLRYKNNLLNDFGYIKKGTILKVPNLYCEKAVLYIDEKMMLPVALSLYDDKGLFESYEFTKIEINKQFAKDEFTSGKNGL
jgi:hypothetical protein